MHGSQDEPTPTATPPVPILDYARPGPSRMVRWLTRPLSPETGLLLWALAAVAIGLADRRVVGWTLLYCGLAWFAVVRLFRWRASWLWKLQAVAACGVLVIGMVLFLAPWAHEHYRADFWWLYNQTYASTYRESLRFAWIPTLGTAWLILVVVGAWVQTRRNDPRQ